jgi:hypothetical protein
MGINLTYLFYIFDLKYEVLLIFSFSFFDYLSLGQIRDLSIHIYSSEAALFAAHYMPSLFIQ